MKSDGTVFLRQFAGFPRFSFEGRFLELSTDLGLGTKLSTEEFRLLYEATLYASFCNIVLNGLGGCHGEIRPEHEANRTGLERQFVAARDRFRRSAGWKALAPWQQERIARDLLGVSVAEGNLAW